MTGPLFHDLFPGCHRACGDLCLAGWTAQMDHLVLCFLGSSFCFILTVKNGVRTATDFTLKESLRLGLIVIE